MTPEVLYARATVVATEKGGRIWVMADPGAGSCPTCAAGGGCSRMFRLFGRRRLPIALHSEAQRPQVGQQVEIELPLASLHCAVWLTYGLPLAVLMLVLWLGAALDLHEGVTVPLAVVALFGALSLARALAHRWLPAPRLCQGGGIGA